jgi:hypothetical protein
MLLVLAIGKRDSVPESTVVCDLQRLTKHWNVLEDVLTCLGMMVVSQALEGVSWKELPFKVNFLNI